jgi:RNA polymerase sigma-70 factor (ECF subfamily)
MLYRLARSILKDDAEAEDALQDAYLAAYRSLASFRGDSRMSSWLARIVINEIVCAAQEAQVGHRRAAVGRGARHGDFHAGSTSRAPRPACMRGELRRAPDAQDRRLPSNSAPCSSCATSRTCRWKRPRVLPFRKPP